MYIPDDEYYELKKKIEELSKSMNHEEKPLNFASHVTDRPYTYINTTDKNIPVFKAKKNTTDAWQLFVKLGKMIHQDKYYFQRQVYHSGIFEPELVIRHINNVKRPTRYDQMTKEQILLSSEMLEKMIGIYNEYFMKANKYVYYDALKTDEFEQVEVVYE